MNSTTKIILGALATTALAWWLHDGPMQFGTKCATGAAGTEAAAPAVVAGVPATQEAVANCQSKVDAVITGKTVNFVTSGAVIAADSQAMLDSLATELKACEGTSVEIAGHTDRRGGDAANMRLSEARASAVAEALVQRGVPTARLLPKGYGETAPLDPADTQEAYTKNRRTEFKVSAAAAPVAGQ